MNSAKRYLVIALSFAICMTVFAAFAPRIAHAITATLVQVVNTSASPVPTVGIEVPFQAAVCHGFGATGGSQCGAQGSNFVVPATTSTGLAVKRLVVEEFDGLCESYNTPFFGPILISNFVADNVPNTATQMYNYSQAIQINTDTTTNPGTTIRDYTFGRKTRFYFNPGDTVFSRIELYVPSQVDGYCYGQVSGNLETQ